MSAGVFDGISRRSLAIEARYEFVRMLRSPGFALPTLLFPPMFYLLFGVIMHIGKGRFDAAHYLMATYCVFGVIAPGLFGFGVTLAMEREQGLITLKRALPMPPHNYLLAKLAMAVAFALAIFCILALIGTTAGGVRLAPAQWALLGIVCALGVVPFCALGMLLGTLVSAQGAPAVANLVYLPMSFLSGLWVPLMILPAVLREAAPLWPAYHLGQLAYAAVGQPSVGPVATHVAVLAAFTLVFLALARRRLAPAT